jgi:hypothetical protein
MASGFGFGRWSSDLWVSGHGLRILGPGWVSGSVIMGGVPYWLWPSGLGLMPWALSRLLILDLVSGRGPLSRLRLLGLNSGNCGSDSAIGVPFEMSQEWRSDDL